MEEDAKISEATNEEIETFREDSEEYNEIELRIKEKRKEIKDLQTKQKQLKPHVLAFMREYEVPTVKFHDHETTALKSTVKFAVSKRTKGLTKKYMIETLTNFFGSSTTYNVSFKNKIPKDKAEALLDYLYENREKTEEETLRHVVPRNGPPL
jgi:hypothetical protein